MRRFALLWLAVSGCFYMDPINQRPSLDIRQRTGDVLFRGSPVTLDAVWNDAEDHEVFFRWRVYAATDELDADRAPFFYTSDRTASFDVPMLRTDSARLVQGVRVVLEAEDERGATARPAQELWIPVADKAPTLELRKDSRYNFVVEAPVSIFAQVGDPDDWPEVPEVAWEVFSPTNQPPFALVDLDVKQSDPDTRQLGKQLTPAGIGDYEVRVTATDALGEATTKSVMISVGPDAPPCLRTLSPIVAPAGSALPVTEPTLFQVHVVADDLDPYPTFNDPLLGTTRFIWFVRTNGGARVKLDGVTGNALALDPASYQPGDLVEVRVEIADRKATPLMCADGSPTCSVASDSACIQRQTWRAEVR